MPLELVPLCRANLKLASPVLAGDGPAGLRGLVEVEEMELEGERLRATMVGSSGSDWLTLGGGVLSLDVRVAVETDDGAIIFVQYRGRSDAAGGPGTAPLYMAPLFETGAPKYRWLNLIQAVGKGESDGRHLTYDWYEVR